MTASLCYWLGITAGAIALVITVMGLLIRFSCAPDPSEEYQIARIQEWTVDESELGRLDVPRLAGDDMRTWDVEFGFRLVSIVSLLCAIAASVTGEPTEGCLLMIVGVLWLIAAEVRRCAR